MTLQWDETDEAASSYPHAFGAYRVLAELGAWELGQVYLAQANPAEARVVIRTFAGIRDAAHGVAVLEALSAICESRDRQGLAVPRPLTCGVEGNLPYIVHEYIEQDPEYLAPAIEYAPAPAARRSWVVAAAVCAALLIGATGGAAFVSLRQSAQPAPPLVARGTDLPSRAETPVDASPPPAIRAAPAPPFRAEGPSTPTAPAAAPAPPGSSAASLNVESLPAGAQVYVDGRASGSTPLTLPAVDPGEHRIRIEMPGYRGWMTTISLGPGGHERIGASLEQ
jgi:hypothetical protein